MNVKRDVPSPVTPASSLSHSRFSTLLLDDYHVLLDDIAVVYSTDASAWEPCPDKHRNYFRNHQLNNTHPDTPITCTTTPTTTGQSRDSTILLIENALETLQVAAVFSSSPIYGRLKIASNACYLVPVDIHIPILQFPWQHVLSLVHDQCKWSTADFKNTVPHIHPSSNYFSASTKKSLSDLDNTAQYTNSFQNNINHLPTTAIITMFIDNVIAHRINNVDHPYIYIKPLKIATHNRHEENEKDKHTAMTPSIHTPLKGPTNQLSYNHTRHSFRFLYPQDFSSILGRINNFWKIYQISNRFSRKTALDLQLKFIQDNTKFDVSLLENALDEYNAVRFDAPAQRIVTQEKTIGRLVITTKNLYFMPVFSGQQTKDVNFAKIATIQQISAFRKIHYGNKYTAIEIVVNCHSHYRSTATALSPDTTNHRLWNLNQNTGTVLAQDSIVPNPNIGPALDPNTHPWHVSVHSSDAFRIFLFEFYDSLTCNSAILALQALTKLPLSISHLSFPLTQQWQAKIISNFQYLMILNFLAERSFNNLSQYPVFPWILQDYTSPTLDLSNPNSFRDLSKPMTAINPKRLDIFRTRFDEMPHPRFICGTHYSSPSYVLYFLLRANPAAVLRLHSGKFDEPDRMFYDMESAWNSATHATTDVKELIPEFFALAHEIPPESCARTSNAPYVPGEFLTNIEHLNFGRRQNGEFVDNVILPPWAEGSNEKFIKLHREALESDYVSQHLHHWIDLIFGIKSRSAQHATLYYTDVVEQELQTGSLEPELDGDLILLEFGRTPTQVLTQLHPPRFASSDDEQDEEENQQQQEQKQNKKQKPMHTQIKQNKQEKSSDSHPSDRDRVSNLASLNRNTIYGSSTTDLIVSHEKITSQGDHRENLNNIQEPENHDDLKWGSEARDRTKAGCDKERSYGIVSALQFEENAKGLLDTWCESDEHDQVEAHRYEALEYPGEASAAICLSVNGSTLAVLRQDKDIRIYSLKVCEDDSPETRRGRIMLTLKRTIRLGNKPQINDMSLFNENVILLGSVNHSILGYEISSGRLFDWIIMAHDSSVLGIEVIDCGGCHYVISSTVDAIKIWETSLTSTGKVIVTHLLYDLDAEDCVLDFSSLASSTESDSPVIKVAALREDGLVIGWNILVGSTLPLKAPMWKYEPGHEPLSDEEAHTGSGGADDLTDLLRLQCEKFSWSHGRNVVRQLICWTLKEERVVVLSRRRLVSIIEPPTSSKGTARLINNTHGGEGEGTDGGGGNASRLIPTFAEFGSVIVGTDDGRLVEIDCDGRVIGIMKVSDSAIVSLGISEKTRQIFIGCLDGSLTGIGGFRCGEARSDLYEA